MLPTFGTVYSVHLKYFLRFSFMMSKRQEINLKTMPYRRLRPVERDVEPWLCAFLFLRLLYSPSKAVPGKSRSLQERRVSRAAVSRASLDVKDKGGKRPKHSIIITKEKKNQQFLTNKFSASCFWPRVFVYSSPLALLRTAAPRPADPGVNLRLALIYSAD